MLLRSLGPDFYLMPGATDMRSGPHRMAERISALFPQAHFGGSAFFFMNGGCNKLRAVWWNHQGDLCVAGRYVSKGYLQWPQDDTGTVTLTAEQVQFLMEGVDPEGVPLPATPRRSSRRRRVRKTTQAPKRAADTKR